MAEDYGKRVFDLSKWAVRLILLKLQGILSFSSSQVAWPRQPTEHFIPHKIMFKSAIFRLYLPETATRQSNHWVETGKSYDVGFAFAREVPRTQSRRGGKWILVAHEKDPQANLSSVNCTCCTEAEERSSGFLCFLGYRSALVLARVKASAYPVCKDSQVISRQLSVCSTRPHWTERQLRI